MKQLLKIPLPGNATHIVWEHLLKSAVAFVGTFALLFFGPMLLTSKRHHRHSEFDPGLSLVKFILEHPIVHFGGSALVMIITNIILIRKNRRVDYVIGMETDEKEIRLHLTDLRCKRQKSLQLPIALLGCTIRTKITDDDKKRTLIFSNTATKNPIGTILPDHIIWSEHTIQLRNMLKKLDQLGITIQKQSNTKNGPVSALFKAPR